MPETISDKLNKLKKKTSPVKQARIEVRIPIQKQVQVLSDKDKPDKPDKPKKVPIFKSRKLFNRSQFLDAIQKDEKKTIPKQVPLPIDETKPLKLPTEDSDDDGPPPLEEDTPPTSPKPTKPTKPKSQELPEGSKSPKSIKPTKKKKLVINSPDKKTRKSHASPEKEVDIPEQKSAKPLEIKQIEAKLPKKEAKVNRRTSSYYLNNREIFINKINSLFDPYKEDVQKSADSYSCTSSELSKFNLLVHQEIVRDYINIYTPYRGLLLYHGLGSGKTCSSIAIAEGLKSTQQVIVMTPASLRRNYMEELKFCGDNLYKKKQFWQEINIVEKPELIKPLAKLLFLNIDFIKKAGRVWLVDATVKQPNYSKLSADQQKSLDKQLTAMIESKYLFINYNGLRKDKLIELTRLHATGNDNNLFSNKVIIIDEAHNFVSRIVNKLKSPKALSMQLYQQLQAAENCRLVFLTGTPIINYPNEIGIMLNMLRGYIKTWTFILQVNTRTKVNTEFFIKLFQANSTTGNVMDYINYRSGKLVITRNPFGFFTYLKDKKYSGVKLGEDGNVDDGTFALVIRDLLESNGDFKIEQTIVEPNKCLPDTLDGFGFYFIKDTDKVHNMGLFKRRILGLVSFFPDIEKLLPNYEKSKDFHLIKLEMSQHQFHSYETARVGERKVESENRKKKGKKAAAGAGGDGVGELYDDSVSTYRVYSRAFCNFVLPPGIKRPYNNDKDDINDAISIAEDEDLLDAVLTNDQDEESEEKIDIKLIEQSKEQSKEKGQTLKQGELNLQDVGKGKLIEKKVEKDYKSRIQAVIRELNQEKVMKKYLTFDNLKEYSPKFHKILEILDINGGNEHQGLHLIYSQFRTLEGIGILSIVLKANGFAQFKIKKEGGIYTLDISAEDMPKPKFVLYTGTEDVEEKEIVRNIFNGTWEFVPEKLRKELDTLVPDGKAKNNNLGEIIKLIMITASGAEGISLKNVRYVHILEPYWHPVRIEQVIGRARRICSHKNLPINLQTVEVFLYLMIFSRHQIEDDAYKEIRGKGDLSKKLYPLYSYEELLDDDKRRKPKSGKEELKYIPFTSDQTLYEISTKKEDINREILKNLKEASIDCTIHNALGSGDKIKCFSFGSQVGTRFSYSPSITTEEVDKISDINKQEIKIKTKNIEINGKQYALDVVIDPITKSRKVYDFNAQKEGRLLEVGLLVPGVKEGEFKLELFS